MSSGDDPIGLGPHHSDSDESDFGLERRGQSKVKVPPRAKVEPVKRVKETSRMVDDRQINGSQKSRPKKSSKGRSDRKWNADDDSDESDEDQRMDHDHGHSRHHRHHKKGDNKSAKQNITSYIEEEASEDDDENGETRRYDPKEQEKIKKMYRKAEPRNKPIVLKEVDPELIEEYYEERDAEEDEEEDDDKGAQFPSANDPRLFSVRCKAGCERDAVASLLRKAFAIKRQTGAVNIFSASAVDKAPGAIYVEAYQEKAVRDICEGLLALNKDLIRVIPRNEVRDLFRPDPTRNIKLEPNTFVRVKTGLYEGDLALVEDIDIGRAAATVKLIPRLLGAGEEETKQYLPTDNLRPQKKLFNPEEYPSAVRSPHYTDINKICYQYKGQTFENGYVKKKFTIKNLVIENVRPSFEEVQSFRKAEPDERRWTELNNRQTLANDPTRNLKSMVQKGDMVRVISGDLFNSRGRAIEVTADHIQVEFEGDFGGMQVYELPIQSLEKIYSIGEQIEVVNGKYAGKTGSIVSFDETKAVFISDDTHEELPVFLTDIRRRVAGAALNHLTGAQKIGLGKYDLISLNDGKTVGLVLALQADSVTLIDLDNFVTSVSQGKVEKKFSKSHVATNTRNESVQEKCVVRVLTGPNRGVMAKVIKVYSTRAFLVDSTRKEAYGVFVEPVESLQVLETPSYDNTRRLAIHNNQAKLNLEREEAYGGMGPTQARPPNTRNNPQSLRLQLIGQTKKIIKGPYKGYEGIIQSITGNDVRFELSAERKVIKIPLELLNVNNLEKETIASANMPSGRTPMFRNPNSGTFNFYNTGTPAYRPFQ